MEFRFRAGDRRSRSQTPAAGFSRPCDRRVSPQGPFHGEPPPLAQPFELEAAAWRERIIRGEVERRLLEEVCLIEEEVRRELAIARARFLGVLGPVPFVGPDGPFNMPLPPLPLPPDTLFGPGGPFLPPGPMPLMPGFDGRMGFEQLMMVNRRPPPPPKPKQKLKLREIKPSKSSKKKQEERYLKMAFYGGRVAASGAGPSDAPKKIHIVVDGEMHEVVKQSGRLWCEHCSVSCTKAGDMVDHLRGKKHSPLNKIWRSIFALRMKNRSKKGAAATCEGKVNENGPLGIPGGR
ncbi:hypothetical protein HU200_042863 [Digitaria exilis]|uniref:C2H2-type domain-containing protein n=1 Tax=Digitaria exilis TaxID=1010633 RepID=A0A835B3P7_9POAL|nr:hypothetical protein HU200_042863 [Digitaria exilis]